jgi:osmotically-inducible protein OsmY
MRSLKTVMNDMELRDAVVAELDWYPSIDTSRMNTAAKDGAIALTGAVTSYPQKWAAVQAAERVYGVKAVADDIQVVLPKSVERKDARIAEEIAHERSWNTAIPASVEVEVSKGHVTLRGEVEWAYQRNEAAHAVRHLAGVRKVTNGIRVRPRTEPNVAEVEHRIAEALGRMADLDAHSIRISTNDGKVQLQGSVRSLAERRIAQHAAEAAPGVTTVENDLAVTL